MHTHNHNEIVGVFSSLWHIIEHSFTHTLLAIPVLFIIYLILEFFKKKNLLQLLSSKYAPVVAGLLGVLPQCGSSIVSSGLYIKKQIKTGTLLAVFLATSDEFIPLVIASQGIDKSLLFIIVLKVFYAIVVAVILNNTLFKNEEVVYDDNVIEGCHCNPLLAAIQHTYKISKIIFISYFFIECIFIFIDDAFLSTVLLSDSLLQPFMAALIGIIPGCYISVLISQLYIMGTLSIGSTVAGLSSAAGFGYIILFRGNKSKAIKILISVYLLSTLLGFVIDLII